MADRKNAPAPPQVNSGANFTVDDYICRALNTVDDLCHGRIRWTMHVPAEPDDPDLVITAGLKRAAEEINDLRLVNAELVEALEGLLEVTDKISLGAHDFAAVTAKAEKAIAAIKRARGES